MAAESQPAPEAPEVTVWACEPHTPVPAIPLDGEHSAAPTAAAVAGAAAANLDPGSPTANELGSDNLFASVANELGSRPPFRECCERARLRPPGREWSERAGSEHLGWSTAIAPDTSAAVGVSTRAVRPDKPAATTTGSDDDLVAVHGSRPSEPLLVRRTWLSDHLRKQPPQLRRHARQAPPRFVPCDPLTGARLDPGHDLATNAYRPGSELAALVRARDGRCRFPGCCVAARFCDLDHVRPWPLGPTTAANLLTLCRRHHRIKQRPGWRVRLAPDGTATWTDPTERARTTAPLDALTPLVLAADAVPERPATRSVAPPAHESVTPMTSWSALETHLGFMLEHHPDDDRDHRRWLPVTHRRCTSAATLRSGAAKAMARAFPDTPPF